MALDNYGRTVYGGGGAEASGFGRTPVYSGTTATDALQALIGAERGGAYGPRRPLGPGVPQATLESGPGGMSAADQHLANLERGARIAQLQAASRPAPQRLVTGANINPGYVDDPSQMNAYTRQLYLPQGSSMQGDINDRPKEWGFAPSAQDGAQALAQNDNSRADWYGLGSYGRYAPIEDERKRQGGR